MVIAFDLCFARSLHGERQSAVSCVASVYVERVVLVRSSVNQTHASCLHLACITDVARADVDLEW